MDSPLREMTIHHRSDFFIVMSILPLFPYFLIFFSYYSIKDCEKRTSRPCSEKKVKYIEQAIVNTDIAN